MSTQFDPEDVYDTLRTEGVFEEKDDELRLTEDFRAARERFRGTVADYDDDTKAELIAGYVDGTPFDAGEIGDYTFADAMAIEETCETVDKATSVHVAVSLDRSEAVSADDHVPAGFVSLEAEDIEPFLDAHAASVIFCWREDCKPCTVVRDNLDELREEGAIPEGLGLGAIYGPDNAETLIEEYDVGGSPTTLFCVGHSIETRYVGNPGKGGLRGEIARLADEL